MHELTLTDAELQKLIAPALKKRLAKAGFSFGCPEAETYDLLMLPINLDLNGFVSVSRSEEGIWTFQQSHPTVQERFNDAFAAHAEAIHRRESPPR